MLQALLAALLFGASAPLAKLLVGEIEPTPLSGFLYLGSGLSLLLIQGLQRRNAAQVQREAPIRRADLPWLAGVALTGGVAAPILLLYSLKITPAATASMLLVFETVATTLIAALVFGEAIGRMAWAAIGVITFSSALLSFQGNGQWGLSLGALGVLGATVLWGLENNLTRQISDKNPLSIVTVKGLAAGSIALLLAVLLGSEFPPLLLALAAMLLGSLSYGMSIVLYVRAMRAIGAARTSALFAASPLAGILLSFLLFRAMPPLAFWAALPLMALGAVLLLNEQHEHGHRHPRQEHAHAHGHNDLHHQHAHPEPLPDSHSHWHIHEGVLHNHHHLPDSHHRHSHTD